MKIANKLKIALKKALSLEFGRIATDRQELVFDGELAVGTEVFVEDENGELVPAPDGEYIAEDGRVIVVADGKVSEIREKEEPAEEPAAEEPAVEEEVAAEEITEPVADPAEGEEPEETETLEEKVARLENIVNGFAEGVERIINAIAALEDRVDAVENKIQDLAAEPAAEPAEEVAAEEEKPKSKLSYLRKIENK